MSRTRRRKHYGDPGTNRDGRLPVEGHVPPKTSCARFDGVIGGRGEDEADRIARGEADPDDVPMAPKPKRLWQFWRRS